MAIRFDASGDKLTRTTTLPSITSFTIMGWVYRVSVVLAYEAAFGFGNATSTYALYVRHNAIEAMAVTNWMADYAGAATTLGTWFHVAMTCAGTGVGQLLGYFNGVLSATGNGNSGVVGSTIECSDDPASSNGEWLNGRLSAVKIYGAVLTAAEIQQEMRCMLPVRTANLNTWSPLLASTDAGNYMTSGAWTVGGTLTTESGPPIPWSLRPGLMGFTPAVGVVTLPARPFAIPRQAIANALL